MPYNPGVNDISGQLLAQGMMQRARGFSNAIQSYVETTKKRDEENRAALAKGRALENLIKTNAKAFGMDDPDKLKQFLSVDPNERPKDRAARFGEFVENAIVGHKIQAMQQQMQQSQAETLKTLASINPPNRQIDINTLQRFYPNEQWDVTAEPDPNNPMMVQVKNVSRRAPKNDNLTPVDLGDAIGFADGEGKIVRREPKGAPIPAGYVPKGGAGDGAVAPRPGGPQEAEARALEEKRQANINAQTARYETMTQLVDNIYSDIDDSITGKSAVKKYIPGSKAMNVSERLDSLKALIGFKELQDMRAASPTGGALGQVAVQELNFLQKAMGSLNQWQSAEELKKNLEAIKKSLNRWHDAVNGKMPKDEKADSAKSQTTTDQIPKGTRVRTYEELMGGK